MNDYADLLDMKNKNEEIAYTFGLTDYIGSDSDPNLDLDTIAHPDDVPNDVFACCLSPTLQLAIMDFCSKTNTNDYRLTVSMDKRIRENMEALCFK